MRRYLSIFLILIVSCSCYSTIELPPYLQNKKWVEIVEFNGEYYKSGTNVLFTTDIDSVGYISYDGNYYDDKWAVEDFEETSDGLTLFRDKNRKEGFYYDLIWKNPEKTIVKWHIPYSVDDYNPTSDFYLIDSMYLHLLPDYIPPVIDTLRITDVVGAVYYMQGNIESMFETLSQDYNKDGIIDKIVSYKEWAYEDDINHSHRYYYTLFFLGNEDGSFRSDGRIHKEIQKPGLLVEVSGEGDTCQIIMSNLEDEENYDPFTNLDATLADFDDDKVKTITETYRYDTKEKQWKLETVESVKGLSANAIGTN